MTIKIHNAEAFSTILETFAVVNSNINFEETNLNVDSSVLSMADIILWGQSNISNPENRTIIFHADNIDQQNEKDPESSKDDLSSIYNIFHIQPIIYINYVINFRFSRFFGSDLIVPENTHVLLYGNWDTHHQVYIYFDKFWTDGYIEIFPKVPAQLGEGIDYLTIEYHYPVIQTYHINTPSLVSNPSHFSIAPLTPNFYHVVQFDVIWLEDGMISFGFKFINLPNYTYTTVCICDESQGYNCEEMCPEESFIYKSPPNFETDSKFSLGVLENITFVFITSNTEDTKISIPPNHITTKLFGIDALQTNIVIYTLNTKVQPDVYIEITDDNTILYNIYNVTLHLSVSQSLQQNYTATSLLPIPSTLFYIEDKVALSEPSIENIDFNPSQSVHFGREWLDSVFSLPIYGHKNVSFILNEISEIEFKNQEYVFYYKDREKNSFKFSPPRPTLSFLLYEDIITFKRNNREGNLAKITFQWEKNEGVLNMKDSLKWVPSEYFDFPNIPVNIERSIKKLTINTYVQTIYINVSFLSEIIIRDATAVLPKIQFEGNVIVNETNCDFVVDTKTNFLLGMLSVYSHYNFTYKQTRNDTLQVYYVGAKYSQINLKNGEQNVFTGSIISNVNVTDTIEIEPNVTLYIENSTFYAATLIFIYDVNLPSPRLYFRFGNGKNIQPPKAIQLNFVTTGFNNATSKEDLLVHQLGVEGCDKWKQLLNSTENLVFSSTGNTTKGKSTALECSFTPTCLKGDLYINSSCRAVPKESSKTRIAFLIIFGFICVSVGVVFLVLFIKDSKKNQSDDQVSDSDRYLSALSY